MEKNVIVEQPEADVDQREAIGDDVGKDSSKGDAAEQPDVPGNEEEYIEYLGKLPPEIGTMLMIVGIAGVLLPGPIGTPMLIAGAVVYWPKTFAPLERYLAKCCPALHREGVRQVKRYLSDLKRRFPDD